MSEEFSILIIQEISRNQPHERNLIRYEISSNHLKRNSRYSYSYLKDPDSLNETSSNHLKQGQTIHLDFREEWLLLLSKRDLIRFFKSSQIRSNDSQRDNYSQIFKNLQFQQRINIERRPNRREERVDEQVKRGGIATDSWTASTGRGWSLKDPSNHLSSFFSALSFFRGTKKAVNQLSERLRGFWGMLNKQLTANKAASTLQGATWEEIGLSRGSVSMKVTLIPANKQLIFLTSFKRISKIGWRECNIRETINFLNWMFYSCNNDNNDGMTIIYGLENVQRILLCL